MCGREPQPVAMAMAACLPGSSSQRRTGSRLVKQSLPRHFCRCSNFSGLFLWEGERLCAELRICGNADRDWGGISEHWRAV